LITPRLIYVTRLWAGLVCLSLYAQDSATKDPVIQANVHLVLVPVTVTDRKGRSVDGLSADNFVVRDEGKVQKIRLDTSDTVLAPVSVVIAVQASGISAVALAKIQKVGAMIQPLIAGDRGRAAVISFDDEVTVQQGFTSDGTKLRTAFETIRPGTIKQAHLFDATLEAVKLLETRPESNRRVLFLLSESRDRNSKAKLPAVIERVQRAGISVYPITYSVQKIAWTARAGNPEDNPRDEDLLAAITEPARLATKNAADGLAHATGGRHLSFATLNGLEEAIGRAGDEIHSQYLLSFTPSESGSPAYRKLEVLVPSRTDVVIRARPGYWP
jgi:VWFA-related protein